MDGWPEVTTVALLTCALLGLPVLGLYLYLRASRGRDEHDAFRLVRQPVESPESADAADPAAIARRDREAA